MKRQYIKPLVTEEVTICPELVIMTSDGGIYKLKSEQLESGNSITQDNASQYDLDDMVGARERGGDFGSLW